jgi:RNA polymerase sigma-70 factor (ECF subfamily)
MSINEAHFLALLKKGDQAAFGTLVHTYSAQVLQTCFRFLLDQADAEDISQEVFIEVYQSIKGFKGQSKLSTWIYRIAVTKCLDELKKRNRKKRISSVGKLLHLEDVANWLGGGSRPDKKTEENETFQLVMAALNTLPDNQRIAFTLSKIEGYTNPEIAEIMNTTTVAVESLIYRGKKQTGEVIKNILKKNDE